MSVFGQENVAECEILAEALAKHFNVHVHVRLDVE